MFRSSCDTIRIPKKESIDPKKCYNCDLCTEGGWTSEADVDIHRRKVHRLQLLEFLRKEENHMCTVCLRPQKSAISLIKHVKTHHLLTSPHSLRVEREIFICDICNNVFFNKKMLITHLHHTHVKTEKKKSVVLECPKCSKEILGKSVWFHFLSHDILSWPSCPICLVSFENTQHMLEHVKSHPGHYFCNICGDTTNREEYFNSHIRRHYKKVLPDTETQEENVSRFFLPGNKVMCVSRASNILKGMPMSNVIQVCIICRAMCLNEEEMRQHIYGEHAPEREVKPKTHICECGEEFFNNVMLKHHIFKLKGDHRALSPKSEVEDVEFESTVALES